MLQKCLVPFPRSVPRHNPVSELYGQCLRPHGLVFNQAVTKCGKSPRGLNTFRMPVVSQETEIKKMAKTGNKEACTILAKQLVQLRRQKNRTYAVGSKLQKPSSAMMKLALMRTATGKEDPELPLLQRISSLELPASEIAIFDESGDEEESDSIVNQVLDEIGIEISGKVGDWCYCKIKFVLNDVPDFNKGRINLETKP
uniref:Uncharacterized protein n=1 Tax=Hucho hucho TaxID=62062 RepID=A0A4W5PKW2_9TELE